MWNCLLHGYNLLQSCLFCFKIYIVFNWILTFHIQICFSSFRRIIRTKCCTYAIMAQRVTMSGNPYMAMELPDPLALVAPLWTPTMRVSVAKPLRLTYMFYHAYFLFHSICWLCIIWKRGCTIHHWQTKTMTDYRKYTEYFRIKYMIQYGLSCWKPSLKTVDRGN